MPPSTRTVFSRFTPCRLSRQPALEAVDDLGHLLRDPVEIVDVDVVRPEDEHNVSVDVPDFCADFSGGCNLKELGAVLRRQWREVKPNVLFE